MIFCSCKKETDSVPVPKPGCEKTVVEITASQLNTNTTWDSCHYYYVKVNVSLSAKLTIQPGTVIKFVSLGGIQADNGGVISAEGTNAHPIVFTSDKDDLFGNDITGDKNTTSPQSGDWIYLNMNGQSNSTFKYCIFQYGGNSSGGGTLLIASSSQNTTVDHCTFKYNRSNASFINARAALDATGGGAGTVITNNLFDQNILPLGVSTAFSLDNSNNFQFSKFACIQVSSAHAPQQNIKWLANRQPLAIHGNLSFVAETLTLGPGVVLKFIHPIYQFLLQKESNLIGRTENGVRFTSIKDDSDGYDSNGDGAATTPLANDWQGIFWNDENKWFSWNNIYYAAH